MRKVLNILQSTWLAYKNVTEDNVYTCVGHPLPSDIENILKWMLNEDILTVYKSNISIFCSKMKSNLFNCILDVKELKIIKGLALVDIITEIHRLVLRSMNGNFK